MIIDDKIELSSKIGHGAFGDVFIGKDTNTSKLYAVKKVTKELLLSSSMKSYFNNEIYLLKHLPPHRNIIKFYSIKETLSNYYVILDYCNGGSLETLIDTFASRTRHGVPEESVRYIIKEILNGLLFLGKNNIIHRDIKAENILLNYPNKEDMINCKVENAEVKIIDFGFARYLEGNQLASSVIGTPLFMDPKILNFTLPNQQNGSSSGNCYYNKKVDIWSLGIVLYQLLFGVLPFNGKDCDDLYKSVTKGNYNFPREKRNIYLTKQCVLFIDKVLNVDMNLRPSAEELIQDKWIKGDYDRNDMMELKEEVDTIKNNEYSFYYLWKKKEIKHSISKKSEHAKNRHLQIENFLERIKRNKTSAIKEKENQTTKPDIIDNIVKKARTFGNMIYTSSHEKDTTDIESEAMSGMGTPIKAENHFEF